MKGATVTLKNGIRIWMCESCLKGDHMSYGCDHRTGEKYRRGCKNLSDARDKQCGCGPDMYD